MRVGGGTGVRVVAVAEARSSLPEKRGQVQRETACFGVIGELPEEPRHQVISRGRGRQGAVRRSRTSRALSRSSSVRGVGAPAAALTRSYQPSRTRRTDTSSHGKGPTRPHSAPRGRRGTGRRSHPCLSGPAVDRGRTSPARTVGQRTDVGGMRGSPGRVAGLACASRLGAGAARSSVGARSDPGQRAAVSPPRACHRYLRCARTSPPATSHRPPQPAQRPYGSSSPVTVAVSRMGTSTSGTTQQARNGTLSVAGRARTSSPWPRMRPASPRTLRRTGCASLSSPRPGAPGDRRAGPPISPLPVATHSDRGRHYREDGSMPWSRRDRRGDVVVVGGVVVTQTATVPPAVIGPGPATTPRRHAAPSRNVHHGVSRSRRNSATSSGS